MTRYRWTKRAAIVFFLLGTVFFAAALWIGRARTPSSWPIQPVAGFTLTRDFSVSDKANYRIGIRYSRSIPFDQLKALLRQGNLAQISLTAGGQAVRLDYFSEPRFQPGIDSTNELGNLGFSEDWISQDIADFAAESGKHYTITCSVLRTVDDLKRTNPQLLVEMDPLDALDGIVPTALLMLAGAMSWLSAFIAIVIYFVLRRRDRVAQRT